jgi:hypothetical protein
VQQCLRIGTANRFPQNTLDIGGNGDSPRLRVVRIWRVITNGRIELWWIKRGGASRPLVN